MVVTVRSLGLNGIAGYAVSAECFLSGGLPAFDIVGLPDAAVREARERVRAAVKNCGAKFPVSRITVNLAPAGQKKAGTVYDLPIFVGLLAAGRELPPPAQQAAFIGELSLTGALRGVTGVLPMALAARDAGVKELYVPAENAAEATLAGGLTVYGVPDVGALVRHLRGEERLSPAPAWVPEAEEAAGPDLRDVMGQENARRALEIAAAGGHNLLLIGSPGAGKSMLAKRLPSILPDMSREEALEVSGTASAAALTGGGPLLRPGEISLAHNGVLFLDELPEFHRDVLEAMRQPLEDGTVTVARSGGTLHLPARFQLVCAMNPCRCGWRGHPSGRCTCSDREVAKYVEKISGPLLDRIDLHVSVPAVEYASMRRKETPESSADVKCRVDAARAVQTARFAGTGVTCNAHMTAPMIGQFCCLDHAGDALMKSAFERMGLSARSYDRLLKVARTIADLDGSDIIDTVHIAEAVQFRSLDRKYWSK